MYPNAIQTSAGVQIVMAMALIIWKTNQKHLTIYYQTNKIRKSEFSHKKIAMVWRGSTLQMTSRPTVLLDRWIATHMKQFQVYRFITISCGTGSTTLEPKQHSTAVVRFWPGQVNAHVNEQMCITKNESPGSLPARKWLSPICSFYISFSPSAHCIHKHCLTLVTLSSGLIDLTVINNTNHRRCCSLDGPVILWKTVASYRGTYGIWNSNFIPISDERIIGSAANIGPNCNSSFWLLSMTKLKEHLCPSVLIRDQLQAIFQQKGFFCPITKYTERLVMDHMLQTHQTEAQFKSLFVWTGLTQSTIELTTHVQTLGLHSKHITVM